MCTHACTPICVIALACDCWPRRCTIAPFLFLPIILGVRPRCSVTAQRLCEGFCGEPRAACQQRGVQWRRLRSRQLLFFRLHDEQPAEARHGW